MSFNRRSLLKGGLALGGALVVPETVKALTVEVVQEEELDHLGRLFKAAVSELSTLEVLEVIKIQGFRVAIGNIALVFKDYCVRYPWLIEELRGKINIANKEANSTTILYNKSMSDGDLKLEFRNSAQRWTDIYESLNPTI